MEERRQHQTAARAANDKEEEAMKEITRAHQSLKKGHGPPVPGQEQKPSGAGLARVRTVNKVMHGQTHLAAI